MDCMGTLVAWWHRRRTTPSTHPEEGTLRAHLDGQLGWRARVACAMHLRRCAGCRALIEELTALDERATRLLAHARPTAGVRALRPPDPAS